MSSIPVIDIAPYRESGSSGREQVVEAVREACETIGFFTVVGHGVSDETVDRLYRSAKQFFELPLEEKLKIEKPQGANYKGYTPNRGRTVGRSQDPTLKPSLNESFAMGYAHSTDGDYFRTAAAGTHFEPNVFPAQPSDFKPAIIAYYAAMEDLSRVIMRIFADALHIDANYFLEKLDRHISVLRAVNYPALTERPVMGEERAGAHADTGAVTILRTDDPPGYAGLEVRTPSGEWIEAYRVPGSFIINIGNTLMRWTNDRFKSTMHRVANPPFVNGKTLPRLSIPYFCQPRYDAVIECIETCADRDNPPRYEPITSGQILTQRYESSYSLDKAAVS